MNSARRLASRPRLRAVPTVELSGLSIVCAGAFNPAIVHPRWLLEKGLIAENAADHAMAMQTGDRQSLIVTPQVATFTADWLTIQVTPDQAIFSTVEEGRGLDLRDVAKGLFDLLPETPVTAVGINADRHWRLDSDEQWHAVGDRFAPKDFWEPLFADGPWRDLGGGRRVGLRTLTVETYREDMAGYLRVEVGPSVRVTPHGVYAGLNAHFELAAGEERTGTGHDAARTIESRWEEARALEDSLFERLMRAE